MPLLDVRTLEKALLYYSDHFDILCLVILSDSRFAQHCEVAVCNYVQDGNTQDMPLSSLVTSELNHTVYAIEVLQD